VALVSGHTVVSLNRVNQRRSAHETATSEASRGGFAVCQAGAELEADSPAPGPVASMVRIDIYLGSQWATYFWEMPGDVQALVLESASFCCGSPTSPPFGAPPTPLQEVAVRRHAPSGTSLFRE